MTYPTLMGLQLHHGTLAQIPRHVGQGQGLGVTVVAVVRGQRAHQLLRRPLAVLGGEPGGEAARGQSIGQLQGSYSRSIVGRMGI